MLHCVLYTLDMWLFSCLGNTECCYCSIRQETWIIIGNNLSRLFHWWPSLHISYSRYYSDHSEKTTREHSTNGSPPSHHQPCRVIILETAVQYIAFATPRANVLAIIPQYRARPGPARTTLYCAEAGNMDLQYDDTALVHTSRPSWYLHVRMLSRSCSGAGHCHDIGHQGPVLPVGTWCVDDQTDIRAPRWTAIYATDF